MTLATPEEESAASWAEALHTHPDAPKQPLTTEERAFLIELVKGGETFLVDPLAERRGTPHPNQCETDDEEERRRCHAGYYDAWRALAWGLRIWPSFMCSSFIAAYPAVVVARLGEGIG